VNDSPQLRIAIVGDYVASFEPHPATDAAIKHAAHGCQKTVEPTWVGTESLVDSTEQLEQYDAIWSAPGSPYRSFDGALNAITFARENKVPFLATCGGCQHTLIEYARNVMDFTDAAHAELNPVATTLFVTPLSCSIAGKVMEIQITPKSLIHRIYGDTAASERYYCHFGLNPEFHQPIHDAGLRVVAVDNDQDARAFEIPGHPFYVATLFVPQTNSAFSKPHPIIVAFVEAAARYRATRAAESYTRRVKNQR
jgi:CTP synthase (UTP-ammonia lyase)